MAVITDPVFAPHKSRRDWIAAVLALLTSIAMVAQLTQSPISCEHHKGAFSNDFSSDFDINSFDCRVSSIKNSPTIRFWGVSPYVGIK
jgi:hypothetical protein